jgi:hypothetical protein
MIVRKLSVRDDTTFLQTLQLENLTANRFISLEARLKKRSLNYWNYFFLSETKFFLPPNGPELSCGNEVPQRRNPVRAS